MSSRHLQLRVLAPLSGRVVPIEAVPDPAFAQKMVGDGLSIDPATDLVLAPIDGRVIDFHEARHALVIAHACGVEIMVHVGLDTVLLAGQGFEALVGKGDTVRAGQPLLRFDAAHVAAKASTLTEIVVVNGGERVRQMDKAAGSVEAGLSELLILHLEAALEASGEPAQAQEDALLHSPPVVLPNPAGLHARPAARLASEARAFAARITLWCGQQQADAKSAVAVMALATRCGDEVRLSGCGNDAAQALAVLAELLRNGCGESAGAATAPSAQAAAPIPQNRPAVLAPAQAGGLLCGVGASPGLAVGRIVRWSGIAPTFDETGGPFEQEHARLHAALQIAASQIKSLALADTLPDAPQAQIMDAHLTFLEDPMLVEAAETHLRSGASAESAWHLACEAVEQGLRQHANAQVRERAADVRDVGARVLTVLTGATPRPRSLPERSIIIADDLTPSDTIAMDRSKVAGLCTVSGGPTSHVAILARSMGIPAVCGVPAQALSLQDGTLAVLDGTAGVLQADPDPTLRAEVERRQAAAHQQQQVDQQTAHRSGRTRDGHRVEVVANVRDAAEAREAVAAGGEGVGLLRSEFLFEDRAAPPDEDEQAAAYQAVAAALGPERPLIARTLDIGGDKPLRYLPLPKEENPFLGLRGIRVSLAYPELFRSQLRAMLRAASGGNLHIMFPMVSDLDEVLAAKRILREEQARYPAPVKIGLMIEVPAAVAIVEALAQEVDFFSIGTNDLTQYTLAIDRGHAGLASKVDALHPAVLRMIALTVEGAHAHGKWVGVCGALASDLAAVPVLVGLGVDELSVSVPAIAAVKAALSRLDFEDCRALARRVLPLGSASRVREVLAQRLV
ncbi:phosphoenolpyruvate--protein phosphotransferase [Ralstonia solanacearum]|uniref:phosphoenolpyruvate--protein phosphotransferase n=1 Tax=Ralstonia solanacearum TaxID=305 RepID=UPI000F613A91|nr:phosphoenolpyruvate--protein phosphotransferase [Ralstonia solanacearum]MCL9843485.1 phosphoenolpyruvate--protein phosphotransferase [Ralstonia solanacearum]MDC6255590.1 phosphoenolpyruvate--protein phosphotransferase [Ralstonia solanacearum]MDC6259977.1 phosphoenolpyruvate--protein phosphotransferase [Ralstonia solanacearum]MDC6304946.1 phosphoenolpyruvate--protein phosphotransferase [Ralstonia solanacearum]